MLDSVTIGVARGARGTRPPLNFHNMIPIWPPRLRESIKSVITHVFVIDTYILDSMTIGLARGVRGTRAVIN